jgi:multiple sugar transport system substrate-binding protein
MIIMRFMPVVSLVSQPGKVSTRNAEGRRSKRLLRGSATTIAVVAALLLAGCAGGGQQKTATAKQPVTITFWHGYNLKADVAEINGLIGKFEALHPDIKVKTVADVADDKLMQGLRSANGPDIVSSFTTSSVGAMCTGGLIDLNPYLKKDNINKDIFIKSRLDYAQFNGNQCTLPLLGDAFGLYYNTDMFKAAGIATPPKTWSEFKADAVKLTKAQGGSYQQLGFMPSFNGYESTASTWILQWSPTWSDSKGKSNLSKDPQVTDFFNYTKSLQDALGGFKQLDKYRLTFGDEWSAQNAFEVGKVAMQLDGEWRTSLIVSDGSKVHFATAPLPVPDNKIDTYGMGPLTGTVIGVSKVSKHQDAAWELVKYLTTNTSALVEFANEILNVPTTVASLNSPDLVRDPNFTTFINISANKNSAAPPASANGGNYQTVLDNFATKWASGTIPDLKAGLQNIDTQIDTANTRN